MAAAPDGRLYPAYSGVNKVAVVEIAGGKGTPDEDPLNRGHNTNFWINSRAQALVLVR
jgi:hypothetical protein